MWTLKYCRTCAKGQGFAGISTSASEAGGNDCTLLISTVGSRSPGRAAVAQTPRQRHFELIVESLELIRVDHERKNRRFLGVPRIDHDPLATVILKKSR